MDLGASEARERRTVIVAIIARLPDTFAPFADDARSRDRAGGNRRIDLAARDTRGRERGRACAPLGRRCAATSASTVGSMNPVDRPATCCADRERHGDSPRNLQKVNPDFLKDDCAREIISFITANRKV